MSEKIPGLEGQIGQAARSQGSHPELVKAVIGQASRDAANVAEFLSQLGLVPAPDRPARLPTGFLLHLGAALRLLDWEARGLRFHRDAGLPSAERAIRDGFARLATHPDAAYPDDLARRVVALAASRLAWHAPRELEAEVVLDDQSDEDDLIDALARLLWRARHTPKPTKEASDE